MEHQQPNDGHLQCKMFADHRREWRDYQYVYPVISRRSGGLSIGINLNPDNACNFDCVYCCVDRSVDSTVHQVDVLRLGEELAEMLTLVRTGELWADKRFNTVPHSYRRLNDIAFSGNGEPTLAKAFLPAVREVIRQKESRHFCDVKLIVITNATLLHRPSVNEALLLLDQHHGEVWAKLDAGDAATYKQINRPRCPLERVLKNLRACGQHRSFVIQSLWMRVHGQLPTSQQVAQFAERLHELVAGGCAIREIHLYTIARETTETWVAPLTLNELATIHASIVRDVPGLNIKVYV